LQRLKQVEDENCRLKHIVARAHARHPGAQGGRRKKVVGPIARREAVGWLRTRGTSLRRACDVDEQGSGTVSEQRLYQLIRQSGPISDPQFEIELLDSGVEVFAFTFG